MMPIPTEQTYTVTMAAIPHSLYGEVYRATVTQEHEEGVVGTATAGSVKDAFDQAHEEFVDALGERDLRRYEDRRQ